jgi:hypothetical protein
VVTEYTISSRACGHAPDHVHACQVKLGVTTDTGDAVFLRLVAPIKPTGCTPSKDVLLRRAVGTVLEMLHLDQLPPAGPKEYGPFEIGEEPTSEALSLTGLDLDETYLGNGQQILEIQI